MCSIKIVCAGGIQETRKWFEDCEAARNKHNGLSDNYYKIQIKPTERKFYIFSFLYIF